jgi:hypothetical protein
VAVTRVVRGWRLEQEPRRFHFVRTSPTTWRSTSSGRWQSFEMAMGRLPVGSRVTVPMLTLSTNQADSLLSAWHQLRMSRRSSASQASLSSSGLVVGC